MQAIINSLVKQGQQGAFKASTVERAEKYLAEHPMSVCFGRGAALKALIQQIRADQAKAGAA